MMEIVSNGPALKMKSCLIHVPAPKMVILKAIVESYNHIATLRTEDPSRELLRVYFSPEMEAEVRELLESLRELVDLSFVTEQS